LTCRRMAILLILLLVTAGFTTGICLGDTDRGEENISLYGGRKGNVMFPHHQHQTVLKDCNLCHDLFDKEAGIIDKMKAEKKLKKKQVMNKRCIKCHRQKKKAGEKSGPTSCKKCHVRG